MNDNLSRRQILKFVALAGVVLPTRAWAAIDPAAEYVHTLGAEVIKLANGGRRGDKALQQRFANLFNRYISIPKVANFALGMHQKDLPPGDKAMFYGLVANYAAALFVCLRCA